MRKRFFGSKHKQPQTIYENDTIANFYKSTIDSNPPIVTFDDFFGSADNGYEFPSFVTISSNEIKLRKPKINTTTGIFGLRCIYCHGLLKDNFDRIYDHSLADRGCNIIKMDVTDEEAAFVVDKVSYNKIHFKWSQRTEMYL